MIDDFNLEQLIDPLQEWFLSHARILPWREQPVPYYVWVSEIMLQQTRVEAVKPYFERFIAKLPDVKALAQCPEDEYLKLWEGLGYYNRVRNLNEAAKQVMEKFGGRIPDNYEQLLTLKGIGSYTAGAIASIAYGKPVPAVDGNVLRVMTRVTADDSDIMSQRVKTRLERILRQLMEEHDAKSAHPIDPRNFNQALMELGAMVCVPNGAPHCEECPWHDVCRARIENRIEELPVKKKAKERRIEKRTVLVIRDAEKVAIHKRPNKGLLAGLYELPNYQGEMSQEEVLEFVKNMGYVPLRIQKTVDAKHIFSHVEWHMNGYVVSVEENAFATKEQKKLSKEAKLLFVDTEETREKYAIPTAFAAYVRLFLDQLR